MIEAEDAAHAIVSAIRHKNKVGVLRLIVCRKSLWRMTGMLTFAVWDDRASSFPPPHPYRFGNTALPQDYEP